MDKEGKMESCTSSMLRPSVVVKSVGNGKKRRSGSGGGSRGVEEEVLCGFLNEEYEYPQEGINKEFYSFFDMGASMMNREFLNGAAYHLLQKAFGDAKSGHVDFILCTCNTWHELMKFMKFWQEVVRNGGDNEALEPHSSSAREYISKHVFLSVGIHPHYVRYVTEDQKNNIRRVAINSARVRVIGVTGLDRYRNISDISDQREMFRWHIQLAKSSGKPLLVYLRDHEEKPAELGGEEATPSCSLVEECCSILQEEDYQGKWALHCFTNFSLKDMYTVVNCGGYIAVSGTLFQTRRFPSLQQTIVEGFTRFPQYFLVQSCSPFLAPPRWKKKWKMEYNEPDSVSHLVSELAYLTKSSRYKVLDIVTDNSKSFLFV